MSSIGALPGSLNRRLSGFVREAHPPAVYLTLSVLWSLSVISQLAGLSGEWSLRATDLLVSLVFFLVLLFLRAVDEIKDLDFDQAHNPDRPLVRGAISTREVWLVAAIAAALAISLSAVLAPVLALFVTINLGYGLGLLMLERKWERFRNGLILNLLITFPVSAALNLYAWVYLWQLGKSPPPELAVVVIAAQVAAFLHLEFGRKLRWPHHEPAGGNGYARVLGLPGAIGVCLSLGLAACALASWVHWYGGAGVKLAMVPWLSLLASAWGLRELFRARVGGRDLKPLFGLFLMSFFALNILIALSRGGMIP